MLKSALLAVISLLLLAFTPPFHQAEEETLPLEVVDHVEKLLYLPAGESGAVYFDPTRKEIRVDAPLQDLPGVVHDALQRAPRWVRTNLTTLFFRLPGSVAERYARLILNCPQRYVDELAFSIAHTPPEVLLSPAVYPEVFLQNVQQLYMNDQYIAYADIVDYEDHSTIRYWVNSSGERESYLMPPGIYYWYVVHPKLTDELPTLIDPSTGRPSPSGYFWRDYVLNHADPSYPPDTPTSTVLYPKATPPLLRELLSGVDTLWNCTPYRAPAGYLDNGTGNRRPFTYGDHAIERVSNWVEKTLPLNVREEASRINGTPERSVQPVRIAHNHYGNCGELQDLTLAAARASLIPARGVLNIGEDHVWCEFWERGWHQWDNYWSDGGTSVDSFQNYDADYPGSWGKDLSTVFAWRGDDYTWTVTDEYTPSATLTARVLDSSGVPLDGATVLLVTENFYNPDYLSITAWGGTDLNGEVHFHIGNNRNFWGEAHCRLGEDPPSSGGNTQVRQIITSSEEGRSYMSTFNIPGALPSPRATLREDLPGGRYLIRVNYTVESAVLHSKNLLTENSWSVEVPEGRWVDFYFTSSDGYGDFKDGRPFEAYSISERSSSGELTCRISTDDLYYAILSNLRTLSTDRLVRVNVTVYHIPSVIITSPPSGTGYVHTEVVEVEGIASSFTGIERVEWRVDGGPWMEAEGTSPDWSTFSFQLDTTALSEGEHTVEVRARTLEGLEVFSSLTIYVYDAISPGVNITSPQKGDVLVQGEPLRVEGFCWDDYTVERLLLKVDEGEWMNVTSSVDGEGRWSVELPTGELPVGDHTVTVLAEDPSSHTAEASTDFYVTERVPPSIIITSPENGTCFPAGESVTVRGTARDNWELSLLVLYLDGEYLKGLRLDVGGGEWEYTLSTAGLQDGPHTLEAVVEDSEGNVNSTSITFLIDGTPPRITLLHPTGEVRVGAWGSLPVRVRVSENMDVAEVYVTCEGRKAPGTRVEGDIWVSYVNLSGLREGRHRFVVHTVDTVGLEAISSGTFILDRTPPEISLTPLWGTFYVGDLIYVNGSIFDPSGIGSLLILVNGNRTNLTDSIHGGVWSYLWDTSGLTPGNYTITVTGEDGVGNTATFSFNVTLLGRIVEKPPEKGGEGKRGFPLLQAAAALVGAAVAGCVLYTLLVRRRKGGPDNPVTPSPPPDPPRGPPGP